MKLFVFTCVLVTVCALPPPPTKTKIVDKGLYNLQNQHDGKFLTAGSSGPSRQEYRAGSDQKFVFTLSKTNGEDSWKLTPLDEMNALAPQYKISYVGHGKSQFKSFSSGLCIEAQGTGRVGEGECNRDEPRQRWYVDHVKADAKN